MPTLQQPLADFVRHRLDELGLSYEAAADRTLGMISRATLHRLAAGKHQGRLGEKALAGLALALDVNASEVRRLMPPRAAPANGPFLLPPRASELDPQERRLILDHIDRLLARKRAAPSGNRR